MSSGELEVASICGSSAIGVPITILTTDAELCSAIRAAAQEHHPVSVASRLEELEQDAAARRSGILITDQLVAQPELRGATRRLRAHEPALVVIAVGSRDEGDAVVALLCAGVADRLMLKPITPASAQMVISSAAQQHRALRASGISAASEIAAPKDISLARTSTPEHLAQRDARLAAEQISAPAARAAPPRTRTATAQHSASAALSSAPHAFSPGVSATSASAPPADGFFKRKVTAIERLSWTAVVVALVVLAAVVWWRTSQKPSGIDPQAVIATNLAAAQRALDQGHTIEPPGRSAADYYNAVLALDPTNLQAAQAMDHLADGFVSKAETAIANGQIAAAIMALQGVQRVRPMHHKVAALQFELLMAQQRYVLALQRDVAQPVAPPVTPLAKQRTRKPSDVPAPEPSKSAQATPSGDSRLSQVQRSDVQHESSQQRAGRVARDEPVLQRDRNEGALLAMNMQWASAQLANFAPLASPERNFGSAEISGANTPKTASVADIGSAGPQPAISQLSAQSLALPKLVKMVRPQYPQDALLWEIEGWVDVSLSVTESGDVVDPRIEDSSRAGMFDRAVLAAVRKWKYEPHAPGSASPPERMTVRVEFKLDDRPFR